MRADARRNREVIVAAALAAFSERGAAAGMEEIARRAGLSVGTLYRHFPDRSALVEHIALTALGDLVAFARAQSATEGAAPTRFEALRRVVTRCAELPLALTASLAEAAAPLPSVTALVEESDALLLALVVAAQREGTLRGDIAPGDVLGMLRTATCRPGARPGDPLTTVLFDGLARSPDGGDEFGRRAGSALV
ncbi:TetR/AcrR family transcriptional regulator [Streptomyces radicis]|uniref:TetR/AcrR family transcriptional regulator n=1 Tax=Streptomyces radicis TaxID=1750517 RepID=A0A3A9VWK4_9ACTN|nr:TetR/AcrR family transcriptional regulator [Streptomyces radicis]RKN05395.1 TetR/AcrR family transcriptional regulator [Streptomyces radicis]RKN16903.1 TetR/AcrR family transcriptional regulator [Streptomyces radicis]